MENIGKRIKELRYQKGMTLEELGSKIGVGKSTVRKWEEGIIQNMRRDKIILVSEALGCTPEFLLGYNSTSTIDDSRIDLLFDYVSNLNDEGINKLLDYAKDLSEFPKYHKE